MPYLLGFEPWLYNQPPLIRVVRYLSHHLRRHQIAEYEKAPDGSEIKKCQTCGEVLWCRL